MPDRGMSRWRCESRPRRAIKLRPCCRPHAAGSKTTQEATCIGTRDVSRPSGAPGSVGKPRSHGPAAGISRWRARVCRASGGSSGGCQPSAACRSCPSEKARADGARSAQRRHRRRGKARARPAGASREGGSMRSTADRVPATPAPPHTKSRLAAALCCPVSAIGGQVAPTERPWKTGQPGHGSNPRKASRGAGWGVHPAR